jgi:hypothetical protein
VVVYFEHACSFVCGNASEGSGEEDGGISMLLHQLPQLSGERLELEP